MTAYGWDLSNHDWDRHPVSLADARRAGISLVTHKATEGNWYRDPYFDDFARQLAHVDFPVAGSYHVLNHGINVNAQTDYWIDYVTEKFPGWRKHPCWIWQIDAEPLDGYAAPTKAEIIACGKRLTAKLGVSGDQIVVYGPRWVYEDRLKGIPYRLWASSYVHGAGRFAGLYPGDGSSVWGAYSGQTPLILQFSSSATIGAQRTCDANAIRVPNEAALQALFVPSRGVSAASTSEKPHPRPAQEDDMPKILLVDQKDAKKAGVRWPGYFEFRADGQLTHIPTIARLQALRAIGCQQKTITVAQYRALGGK